MKHKIKAIVVIIMLVLMVLFVIWFGLLILNTSANKSGYKPAVLPSVSIENTPLDITTDQLYKLRNDSGNLQPALLQQYINEYRGINNLPLLENSGALNKSAELKLNDMIAFNYFSHDSPSGLTPWYFINQAGYTYKKAGENLAYGHYKSEQKIVEDWIASPTHKANLLNADYKDFGVYIKKVDDFNNQKDVYVIVLHLAH